MHIEELALRTLEDVANQCEALPSEPPFHAAAAYWAARSLRCRFYRRRGKSAIAVSDVARIECAMIARRAAKRKRAK